MVVILELLAIFCEEWVVRDVVERTDVSKKTIIAWNRVFRSACKRYLDSVFEPVGQNGSVVQIDETLLTRREYNRERVVREQWLFGAIDAVSNDFVIRNADRRTAEVLRQIIHKTIEEGSIVISDQ